jgi:flagella synthesis protein FlgN
MAKLIDLIDYQLENAHSLSALLEQEKLAITARISTEIETLAKDKLDLISRLRQTDDRIASHTDVQQLIDDECLAEKVALIRSIVHDCQQTNEVNGEALQRAHLSYHKLNNLMQQSRGKIGMTYTAGGQTNTISTLGTNIKA